MYGVKNSTIGGTDAGAGNVISGNTDDGVFIHIFPSGGGGPNNPNVIQGNLIGTTPAGDASIPNGDDGISMRNAAYLSILGGTTPGARNVIAGNGGDGIELADTFAHTVEGNYIGTTIGLTPLPNSGHGVFLSGNAVGNSIGGSTPGSGNVIAYNSLDGISAADTSVNAFLQNSIHSNGGLGIDLGPSDVTPNDAGDSDTGPNDLQNFPVLSSAVSGGGSTTI